MTPEDNTLKPIPKGVAIVHDVWGVADTLSDETKADYLKWFNNVESINATLKFVETPGKTILTPNFYNGLRGTRDGLVKEGYDKGYLVPRYSVQMDGV